MARGWAALLSLLVFLLFGALVLPIQSRAAENCSASVGSPDTSLVYSARDLYQMAEFYGEAGREAYIRARFSFGLVFPLVYTFFLVTCISWLLSKALPVSSSWRVLNLVPLAGMVFDFLENFSASAVIGRYPLESPLAAALAPAFTFMKWVFVGGSFLLLAASLVIFLLSTLLKNK